MRITTKTGDKGQTSLFGGSRVDKDHIRVECNGLMDELNSRIGMIRVSLAEDNDWHDGLIQIQTDIMAMMSHIATPSDCPKENKKKHPTEGLQKLENWVVELNDKLSEEKLAFILPGGNQISALCHLARTAARTAERKLVSLSKADGILEYILNYVNRMSDLFFLLAYDAMKEAGDNPDKWMLFPSQK